MEGRKEGRKEGRQAKGKDDKHEGRQVDRYKIVMVGWFKKIKCCKKRNRQRGKIGWNKEDKSREMEKAGEKYNMQG